MVEFRYSFRQTLLGTHRQVCPGRCGLFWGQARALPSDRLGVPERVFWGAGSTTPSRCGEPSRAPCQSVISAFSASACLGSRRYAPTQASCRRMRSVNSMSVVAVGRSSSVATWAGGVLPANPPDVPGLGTDCAEELGTVRA